ncbi:MAG: hypothetical protein JWR00_4673 [Rubritepida sp.]|nr:hypothetical protein [Rubritepida sp.]
MSDSILTVVTPAPDRRLATAADVRPGLGPSDTISDNDLNALIGQVSDLISSACNGRVFGRESLREVFRPARWCGSLILSRDQVATITSLVADGATLTEGTDFEVDAKAGLVNRLAGNARCSWRAVKVTVEYAAGWLLPSQGGSDLPGDVRRVCIDRVTRIRAASGRDPNVRSESSQDVGQVSYFDPDKLSAQELCDLAPYKVYRL